MCVICTGSLTTGPGGFLAAPVDAPATRAWDYAAPSDDLFANGLNIGTRWSGPAITYTLPADLAAWGDGFLSGYADELVAPTAALLTAVDLLLADAPAEPGGTVGLTPLAGFTLLGASRTDDLASATLRIGVATTLTAPRVGELLGAAAPPGYDATNPWTLFEGGPTSRGGDTWIAQYAFPAAAAATLDAPTGSFPWYVLAHEIGHALGLKHPFDLLGPPGIGGILLPAEYDLWEFTVMAYNSSAEGQTFGPLDTAQAPQTWMLGDIRALQHLYGANYGFRAGDTTYVFRPDSGEVLVDGAGTGASFGTHILATIWDGNGIDTYDASAYATPLRLDLAPGGGSVLSQAQLAVIATAEASSSGQTVFASANVFNALLVEDDPRSLIENALGGSGADLISGNRAANRLVGNGAGDTLIGLAGSDTLDGGAGADSLVGGRGGDLYHVDDAADAILEEADGGIDTVLATGSFVLPDQVEALTLLAAAGAADGTGNALANLLRGNDLANRLAGGGGSDLLSGLAGDDDLDGGDEDDLLDGGAGDDVLRGGAGNDRLLGGTGSDSMEGGAGDDRYIVDSAGDLVIEAAGGGHDSVEASVSLVLPDHVEHGRIFGAATDLTGNALHNELWGNRLADTVRGLAGADTLYGLVGSDRLDGGGGADRLFGGAGRDLLRGNGGHDRLSGEQGNDRLLGGAGDDTLDGGRGRDDLRGGDGNDELNGGAGDDMLSGGGGADRFVFDGLSRGRDLLLDVAPGEDRISLAVLLADFDAVLAAMSEADGNAEIALGDHGSVVLVGIAAAQVTADLFVFA